MEEKLKFIDDELFVYTPLPKTRLHFNPPLYDQKIYKMQLVMTKEVFQECYKKWIDPGIETGYWIKSVVNRQHKIKCSKCGYSESEYASHIRNYCPNCGVKMNEDWLIKLEED